MADKRLSEGQLVSGSEVYGRGDVRGVQQWKGGGLISDVLMHDLTALFNAHVNCITTFICKYSVYLSI